MEYFLRIVGKTLERLPTFVLKILSYGLGFLLYHLLRKRRRVLLSNLHHAFEKRPFHWHDKIARESCRRTVESALFVLSSPYFSQKRIEKHFSLHPQFLSLLEQQQKTPSPTVIVVPHFSLTEAITLLPALAKTKLPETGVIYRPFDCKGIEKWVKATRERFGLRLLSRKKGFQEAIAILKRKGCVAVLFDQNAGHTGGLTTFFDRIASTSELPGFLAKKCQASLFVLYPKRQGFFQATLHIERLPESAIERFTPIVNQWLEKKLEENDNYCADWLWLHNRWRCLDEPSERLQLKTKRNHLSATLAIRGQKTLPRKTRLWIRMPNWLGDVLMTLPLLRAIRKGRPDMAITLLLKTSFIPLLKEWQIADHFLPLPEKSPQYFLFFWKLRRQYPDLQILFTHSFRGDLEAKLIDAPQRFGMSKKSRPLLTHVWTPPQNLDINRIHQVDLWMQFLGHFGLKEPLDCSPIQTDTPKQQRIGLICGTENMPSKRWPAAHWKTLISSLRKEFPPFLIYLFGTESDRRLTKEIAAPFTSDPNVHNLAGKTDLVTFAQELSYCRLVIANDTGGMHLANALGIPLIAIYGPTNPIRTGPVFTAPHHILMPKGSPATGGVPIEGIKPTIVFKTAQTLLHD